MNKISVAVLRGGPSSEYDISLMTGAGMIKHLSPKKYTVHDILIDKKGKWHRDGMEKLPAKALQGIDVVMNGLHGEFGEDGKVQQILDALHVPYTGSQAVPSALTMNKILAKKAFKKAGLKIGAEIIVDGTKDIDAEAGRVFKNFPLPAVVKPSGAGSSVGVSIVRDLKSLTKALQDAAVFDSKILVEQYIKGREATCGVTEDFRGEKYYAMLPIEIIPPPKADFFDREVKYNGETKEICPANFDKKINEKLQEMAIIAHKALGMRHYSRSDFIVTEKGDIYILETNSLPGMTPNSLIPKALIAVGSSYAEFLDHLIILALKK